jgi:DNA (cytosine-5)-methyltransferase 1
MNALSLFSGIGGLDLAAEAAGIRAAAMCERDPFCRAVLRKHWPDVPIFEDVRQLSKEVMTDAGVPPIHIIHGGFPCQ